MNKPTNGNRPKIELLLNQPMRVKLLKEKPFEGSSTYGAYWLYSVEHEGVEHAFFATPEVNQEISRLDAKSGDEIVLTKVAHQNGRRISPQIHVEVVPKPKPETKPENKPKDSLADSLKAIMETSVREAVEITRAIDGVPFQNADIQKIASCLFIARTRMNGFA
ncbi:MAG: hypothetical protein ABSF91_10325 [Bacteroidota bacterium]|jgi:hypothetical protein